MSAFAWPGLVCAGRPRLSRPGACLPPRPCVFLKIRSPKRVFPSTFRRHSPLRTQRGIAAASDSDKLGKPTPSPGPKSQEQVRCSRQQFPIQRYFLVCQGAMLHQPSLTVPAVWLPWSKCLLVHTPFTTEDHRADNLQADIRGSCFASMILCRMTIQVASQHHVSALTAPPVLTILIIVVPCMYLYTSVSNKSISTPTSWSRA